MLSGIPASLLNPQIESMVRDGRFNTDFLGTGKSIYESALIGAAFGGLASLKSPRTTNESVENRSPNIAKPIELEQITLSTLEVASHYAEVEAARLNLTNDNATGIFPSVHALSKPPFNAAPRNASNDNPIDYHSFSAEACR